MSIIAAWKFNNTLVDEVGSFDLTKTGNPFKSSSPTPHEGSHCGYGTATDYFNWPAALQTALKNASAFTVQYWVYISSTGGIQTVISREGGLMAVNPGGFGSIHDWTDGNRWVADFNGWINTITGITNDSWERVTMTWTGTQFQVWWGTSTTWGPTPMTTNPFNTQTTTALVRMGVRADGIWPMSGGFDRMVIADHAVTSGAELPIPLPVSISSVNPDEGPESGGTSVTIYGSGFQSGATVEFDGNPATSVVWVDATEITCDTPAGTAGAVDVKVTNPDTGEAILIDGFTYQVVLTITTVVPNTGPTSGGQEVVISGTLFSDPMQVWFGGGEATDVVVDSSTQLTCKTPEWPAGLVDVKLKDQYGSEVTKTDGYTFQAILAPTFFNKNLLYQAGAWLIFLELTLPDDSIVRIVRNTEQVTWRGYTWLPFPFDLDDIGQNSGGEVPDVTIRVSNVTREIQAYLEANGGASESKISLYVVHSDGLGSVIPAWTGDYEVLNAKVDTQWAYFTCGLAYSLNNKRPRENWQKYICPFAYGKIRCGVPPGTIQTFPTCDKTLANCEERQNQDRFGAELGIPGGYFV